MKIDTNDLPIDYAAECLREFCLNENGQFFEEFRDCVDIPEKLKGKFQTVKYNKYNPVLDLQFISDGYITCAIIDKDYIYFNANTRKLCWQRFSKTA